MDSGYRLIALDLDGTVVRPDGTVSARTVRAIKQVTGLGVEVLPVTARPPTSVHHVALRMGLRGQAVCSCGAARLDLRTGGLSARRPLSGATARDLADRVRARCPEVAFGWVHDGGITVEDAYPYDHPDRTVGALDDLPDVIAVFAHCAGTSLAEEVALAIADDATLGHHTAEYAEIVAPGVDKLSALREVCAERGITAAEVLAFGDGVADADMLRWAGRGVAVADAHPDALAAADLVAAPCAEDGVAAVLEDFLAVHR
ncbi:HAD family hydrolase [Actinokineospora sp. HUAS TT18]|uniref:HAD family hydrolase n=1 Tax=Actinokineospora sp. HUAS TT18 TaxID=3447451 RepID=UPI003F528553